MTKKLQNDIIKAISFVPGLVGLAKVEVGVKGTILPKKDLAYGLSIKETPKGTLLNIGVVIDADIRAKIVAKEVTSAIKSVTDKSKVKISKIVVYVRGVK